MSGFSDDGKKSAWETYSALLELTGALRELPSASSEMKLEVLRANELLFTLQYNRTSKCNLLKGYPRNCSYVGVVWNWYHESKRV